MKGAAKLLRFPLGGLAKDGSYRDTTYPTEESVYSTPMAKNVIGSCAFSGRLRGGSRPGLKLAEGVTSSDTARWLWPNGEQISAGAGFGPWNVTIGTPGYTYASGPTYDGGATGYNWRIRVRGQDGWLENWTTRSDDGENATHLSFNAASFCDREVTGGVGFVFDTLESVTGPDGSQMVLSHPPTCLYRDRVFKAEGSVWMASRTGEHGDFDFGGESDDPTRPCAGNLAYAGRKGEPITAFAPFGDSRIFIATRRSLSVITGEPTSAMSFVSENVGIVSADAWCNADGALFFVGDNGLYAVGDGAATLVSRQIPRELTGLDYALLVYDPHYRGIHVFTESGDWFYDIERKAFWPVEYPATMMPDAGGVALVNNVNRVIFHCVDGEWRYWDDEQTTDDGEPIQSSVAIGPFKCGINDDVDGMLAELHGTLAKGSASVGVTIYTAHSAEDAVRALTEDEIGDGYVSEFSITDGWNPVIRPRIRGAWAIIELDSVGPWAYESIQANIKVLGRLRA